MKIPRKIFVDAVSAVFPFAQKRSSMSIFESIKIESDGAKIMLTASSIDSQIQYWFDCCVDIFSVCADAKAIKQFSSLCIDDVEIKVKGTRLNLSTNGAKASLKTIPSDDLPIIDLSSEIITEIDWSVIVDEIQVASRFCRPDFVGLPQVRCVQIKSDGAKIRIFGTDKNNLCVSEVNHISAALDFCIPGNSVKNMSDSFKSMVVRENQIELRSDNCIAIFKTADCKSLNIEPILNLELKNSGKINRDSLISALSFVGAFRGDGKLRCTASINASADSSVSLTRSESDAVSKFEYSGDEFNFGVYQDSFLMFMKELRGESTDIKFDSDNFNAQIRLFDGNRLIITTQVKV